MFKPFYVHYNRPVHKDDSSRLRHAPRGFTVLVAPHAEREIAVSIAQCSAKDEFIKKEGRSFANDALPVKINPRDLPRLLGDLRAECWGQKSTKHDETAYMYTLKYVV